MLIQMVEIPKNSATQAQRDKLSEAVKEFDAILKPGGQIIYLGTPQTESSLYNTLQDRGYKARVWPVRYPPLEECEDHYQDTLAPFIYDKLKANPALAGQPTDPQRFDELEITKRELSYGKAGFALQFMLNTRLSDAEKYPLKVADLIVTPLDLYETSVKWAWANGRDQLIKDIPCTALTGDFFYAELSRSAETMPYDYTIMAIDPSGRGKDETSYAVLKYLNGYLFLMDVGGFKEGYSDIVLTQLANRAKFWNVDLIVPEDNYGDGMDCYKVGVTLGSGASVPFVDGKFWFMDHNYATARTLDNGPIRTTVELTYAPFDVNGTQVSLVKTISLDANQRFNRMDNLYEGDFTELPIAAGFVRHDVKRVMNGDDWMGMVEPASDSKDPVRDGDIYLGVILPGGEMIADTLGHAVAVKRVKSGETLTYYAGSGWSQGGVEDMGEWVEEITAAQAAATRPLTVTVRK